jgi:hypothetical protein
MVRFALTIILSMFYQASFANIEFDIQRQETVPITKGILLRATPRAISFFEKNIANLISGSTAATQLKKLGTDVELGLKEGYMGSFKYVFQNDLNLDPADNELDRDKEMIKKVHEFLTTWFVGLQINPHRPGIHVGESGYYLEFEKFILEFDQERSKEDSERGVYLRLKVEIKELSLGSYSLKIFDHNNPFLGEVEFVRPSVSLAPNSPPVYLEIPFRLNMIETEEGNYSILDFEAETPSSNFEFTDFIFEHKDLTVPEVRIGVNGKYTDAIDLKSEITVEINGHVFPLNTKLGNQKIDQEIRRKIDFAKRYADNYIAYDLATLLNTKADQLLTRRLRDVVPVEAILEPEESDRPDLLLGFELESIRLRDLLEVNLTGFVEDPLNYKTPFDSKVDIKPLPIFTRDLSTYDLSLGVHVNIVNRLLELSLKRGNLNDVEIDDEGTKISITKTPQIAPLTTKQRNRYLPTDEFKSYIRARVEVQTSPSDLIEDIFLKNKITVTTDVIIRLEYAPDGIKMRLWAIDTDYMEFSDDNLSTVGSLFSGTVRSQAREALKEISRDFHYATASDKEKYKATYLDGSIPLPPQLFGHDMEMLEMDVESSGYLIMYLNYMEKPGDQSNL